MIFAALISAAHLSISLWMNFWRYSGGLRSGATKTEPNSLRRSSGCLPTHRRLMRGVTDAGVVDDPPYAARRGRHVDVGHPQM